MVVLTSRVALIAASISLAAISNAPTVDGIAIPAVTRSEVVARHTLVRRESPGLEAVIRRKGKKMEKEKGEEKDNLSKNGKGRHHNSSDTRVHSGSEGSDSLLRKRSPEQKFLHVRRGAWPQPDHGRNSPSRRAPPRIFITRGEGNATPGYIALEGSETRKDYGFLAWNSTTGDIDASDQATVWNRIPVTCPQDSGFQHCASFAMITTSDKNLCITFPSESTEPSRFHGDYCRAGSMAGEEAAANRSQTFGYHPNTGRIEPLPSGNFSSRSTALWRRESGEQVALVFSLLEQNSSVNQSNIDSSKSDSTSASSDSTATAAETTTLTVTVTAESEPTTSPADLEKVSTASTTGTSSPTQTSSPLVVKVFGNSPSSTTDGVSMTTSATAAATTTASTSSVDGNAIASSIAAEYSSSSVASTTTTDSSSTSTDAARR